MLQKKVSLTGVKSTGRPHLGNYIGAIRPAIEMSKDDSMEHFYFIADYHALNSVQDPKQFKDDIYEVAATWLALGLDPQKVHLYRQADIPEILELFWILTCFTSKGLMNRAHSYKAMVHENQEHSRDDDNGINMGIFNYPILMAADILMFEADFVPVGADQLQHLEMTRDIAQCFNSHYTNVFKMPREVLKSEVLVTGLDGRKMSKSYNNSILIFDTEKKLKKTINKIITDSTPPETPKDPKNCNIMSLFRHFASKEEVQALEKRYRQGIGWGEAKTELFKVVNDELQAPRQKYQELIQDRDQIDQILRESAARIRPKAQKFLQKVKKTIGA